MSEDGSEDGSSAYDRPASSLKMCLQRAGDQIRGFMGEISAVNAEIGRIKAEKDELKKMVNHSLEDTKDYALQNALRTFTRASESLSFQRIENKNMSQQVEMLKDDRKHLLSLIAYEKQRVEELQRKLTELMRR